MASGRNGWPAHLLAGRIRQNNIHCDPISGHGDDSAFIFTGQEALRKGKKKRKGDQKSISAVCIKAAAFDRGRHDTKSCLYPDRKRV